MLQGKIRDRSDRTIFVPYKDGFEVEIRYTPRGHATDIAERCTKEAWSGRVGGYESVLDKKKFYQLYGSEVVVGWRGLTPGVLQTLVDMDEYPKTEVPYSVEDAAELLEKVPGFDVWVQSVCRDLAHFQEQRRDAELKNS